MAAELVGLEVHVKLKGDNPDTSLYGFVAHVQDQKLFLTSVVYQSSGRESKELTVHGKDIADIEVVPPEGSEQLTACSPISPVTVKLSNGFTDPAILSYERTPWKGIDFSPSGVKSGKPSPPSDTLQGLEVSASELSATLTTPFSALEVKHHTTNGNAEGQTHGGYLKDEVATQPFPVLVQSRKDSKQKALDVTTGFQEIVSSPEQIHAIKRSTTGAKPAAEEKIPTHRSGRKKSTVAERPAGRNFTKSPGRKQKGRSQRAAEREALNGWGTEDATDVQELGDFNFEENLSKFDKRAVFDQIKNEDTTADEDRLVSFNRVRAHGVSGATKLHASENVLDRPRLRSRDMSNSGSEEEDVSVSVSSLKMKRALSRTSLRQGTLRKDGAMLSESVNSLNRLDRSMGLVKYTSSFSATSPTIRGTTSPICDGRLASKLSLRYVDTKRVCPVATPENLREAEVLAQTEFGLSEDILAENAARGIAEIALSAISPGGGRLSTRDHNLEPVIVILVGNSIAGARALAAARHLHHRGIHAIVSVLGTGSIGEILATLRNEYLDVQVRRFGGSIMSWEDTAAFLKTLDAPPELIIDGLLGAHSTLRGLDESNNRIAMDMFGWANKSRAGVLAVDVPSGVDGLTGEVEMREGEPAEVRAKLIVCCGIPTIGLRRAMEMRLLDGEGWRVFVCDTGINRARRQLSERESRSGKCVRFGGAWMVEVGLAGEE